MEVDPGEGVVAAAGLAGADPFAGFVTPADSPEFRGLPVVPVVPTGPRLARW